MRFSNAISLSAIREQSRAAIRRFPVAFVCILVFTSIASVSGMKHSEWLAMAFCACFWSITITLVGERQGVRGQAIVFPIAATICLIAIFLFAAKPTDSDVWLFVTGSFLLSFVAPFFLKPGTAEEIVTFAFDFATAVLWSFVVGVICFVGGSSILGAMQYLLGLGDLNLVYVYLFIVIACFVSPMIALGGVPQDFSKRECDLKNLVRALLGYILLPMLLVYAVVLNIYAVTTALSWELPKGRVGYMVLSFGIFALLAYATVLATDYKERIFSLFRKLLPFTLVAPVILLLIGIFVRVADYGLTEDRYFLIIGALWLLNCLLFISRRNPAHTVFAIFAMPPLLLLAASFGPWGADNLSNQSQLARLAVYLHKDLPAAQENAYLDSARYLIRKGSQDDIRALLKGATDDYKKLRVNDILLNKDIAGTGRQGSASVYYQRSRTMALDISGYDFLQEVSLYSTQTTRLGDEKIEFSLDKATGVITMESSDTGTEHALDLKPFLVRLANTTDFDKSELVLEFESGKFKYIIMNLGGQVDATTQEVMDVTATIAVLAKKK